METCRKVYGFACLLILLGRGGKGSRRPEMTGLEADVLGSCRNSEAARSGRSGERVALSGLMARWTKQGAARSDLVTRWTEQGAARSGPP
ncbi:hypothetical protein HAX54_043754 [Datura stramonium]|uniref:Secreted protein n=1 Tax=Datura stramonium TaxID=4076 RepID=A0ABS8W438_DATST|nr:hypothetical protein [Datura stramonium]